MLHDMGNLTTYSMGQLGFLCRLLLTPTQLNLFFEQAYKWMTI